MENKLIKTKIENLIKETKQLRIDEVISYIKIKFPENEFSWENIDERSDFYYDRRDIIHLTNQTDLIINYPGGDRFGDIFAEPYTDISFHNLKLINKYDDLEDKLYLFLNDKYNSENKISNYVNELSRNDNLSIEEIIMHLSTDMNIPNHILNQISNEQLQNIKVREAIVNCVENSAFHRHFDACDQYQYGQYGGEDVDEWRLSKSLQFMAIWENLPDKVREKCNYELEKAWLQIPDTKNVLNEEIEQLQERIDILYQLESNQDNIIRDIHNRYILLEKYDTYLSDDFPLRKAISTLWWNCLEQLDTDNHLEFINNKISEINNCRKELDIENTLLKQENEILQQKRYYFWRWEEKNKDRERLADNLNEINKNNDTVAELEEQLNTLSKKYNIGIQLKGDICKMVENNPIKDINTLYQDIISDYHTNNLNNYAEEEFIGMIKDITSSKLLQLEPMNNELINLNETLSKIGISKSDNEIENDDNVYKEYNIIYKNEDNYEMEM